MGAWTKLTILNIVGNKFNGTLSTSMGQWWANMTRFLVSRNNLSGSLPASIGAWTKLEWFFVVRNQLTGTVPKGVANWTFLSSLEIQGNSFNGYMPTVGTNTCLKNSSNGDFVSLWADCLIEIVCACCNYCCHADGDLCVKQ
jgi:hypothetical protein